MLRTAQHLFDEQEPSAARTTAGAVVERSFQERMGGIVQATRGKAAWPGQAIEVLAFTDFVKARDEPTACCQMARPLRGCAWKRSRTRTCRATRQARQRIEHRQSCLRDRSGWSRQAATPTWPSPGFQIRPRLESHRRGRQELV
jgi:hypothetical protein